MGFIESPYKKVEGAKVNEHVKITQVGDGGFELGQVVLREEFERINRRLKKAGSVEAWGEPHAFYLAAWEEENLNIAQANARVDGEGNSHRRQGHRPLGASSWYRSRPGRLHRRVAPAVVSVAASLIPFLGTTTRTAR
jgi:DNA-directed RNA polymerase subunit beta